MDYGDKFEAGLEYDEFLSAHGTPDQQQRWRAVYERVRLTAEQQQVLRSFRRQMKVMCLAGAWCGDCVEQCPIYAHFALESPCLSLRFFDRDAHPDLAQELSICGGARVPVVLFLSEDDHPVGRYGDRTLAKYRQLGAHLQGAACPSGVAVDQQLLDEVTQQWLNEFERVHWILRTSPRLRQKYGD